MLRVVLLFTCVCAIVATYDAGARGLGVGDTVSGWVSDASDTAKDKYASTKEWAAGTKEAAAASAEDSRKRVAAKKEELGKKMEAAYKDGKEAAVAAAKEAWKDAFPTCTELGYVARSKLNASLSGVVEDVFAAEVCIKNVSSAGCLTFIEDTLVSIIFEGLWTPVEMGIGSLSIVGAMLDVKKKVKEYFKPYILVAAKPPAAMIQKELIKKKIDLSGGSAAVAAAKTAIVAIKDEVCRQAENSVDKLCEEIGLRKMVGAEGSETVSGTQRLHALHHAFFVVPVVTVLWLSRKS